MIGGFATAGVAPVASPVAGSIALGHRSYDRGGASGLTVAVFRPPIKHRCLAGDGELRVMFLHAVANASSARLDRAAERLDIIHTCAVHRPAFGQRKRRNKNPGRDDETIFCEHGTDSFIVPTVWAQGFKGSY
jgi:hypothetical protein